MGPLQRRAGRAAARLRRPPDPAVLCPAAVGRAGTAGLKREDLLHTGAHKLNNSLGQHLLTRRMGKPRVIAETGAGQHGVATATVAALLGQECRLHGRGGHPAPAPQRRPHGLLGTEVRPVATGTATLKDAINEALRDWVESVGSTHYAIGSVVGPNPTRLVREFQRVIGDEARAQIMKAEGRPRPGRGLCRRRVERRASCSPGSSTTSRSGWSGSRPAAAAPARRPRRLARPRRGRRPPRARSYVLQDPDGQVLPPTRCRPASTTPASAPSTPF